MNLKEELIKSVSKQINEKITLEIPPSIILGDYSLPCFKLSKKPEELKNLLKLPKFIEKTEIKGPYLNFFINKQFLAETTINQILKEKENYGSSNLGKGKNLTIEHTSINPNASPHVGRARNAIIGDSIVRILRFQKYKVKVHYYVNDIGKQIAMLVLASKSKSPKFSELLNLYVEFNKKLESNPELEKEVFTLLNNLENGDKKIYNKFKKIVDICVKGQIKILNELNIKYDIFDYESKYIFSKETENILKTLESKNKLFIDNEGRKTANLEGFNLPMENPYLPLTRKDGTTLYMLRDLAYEIEKLKEKPNINLIILGEDQKLYYLQKKALLSILGHKSPEVIHYSFVLLSSGKMSTRKGEVVLLEDFMKETKEKSKEIIEKHGNIKNIDELSKTIAYGAIKFGMLKVSAEKNIIFDLEKAMNFEGESGPYIQYAYVRANSIIKKTKMKTPIFKLLKTNEESNLISKLSLFPEMVKEASLNFKPHLIANYLLELSKLFNEFYHACPVINETNKDLMLSRLAIVNSTKQVLKNGLNLLGIEAPEQM